MYKIYEIFGETKEVIGEFDTFKLAYNQAHRLASKECKELNEIGYYYIDRTIENEINIIDFDNAQVYKIYLIEE